MIFLLQLVSSLSMTVIIGLVQVLIYPQFAHVHESNREQYHLFHQLRITYLVGPLMLTEAATLVWLWFDPLLRHPSLLIASVCLLLIWLQTAFHIVPIHHQLTQSTATYQALVQSLVRANRYRTSFWIIKSIALVYLVSSLLAR